MEAADAPPPVAAVSPVTGGRLGAVPATAPRAVADAAREARAVQRLWATLRPADRARYMARAAQAVIDEFDELADLLALEQGRPRAEAEVMELLAAVETLQWLAEAGPADPRRRADRVLAHPAPDQARALVLRAARRGRRARTGGRAVRHPAGRRRRRADGRQRRRPQALAARRAGRRAHRAHLHPRRAARRASCASCTATPTSAARSSRRPRSTRCASRARRRAGRAVGEACARGLKRSVLELGGKDPMLVLADANVARSARGAVWGAFANAGQCGGSIERAYVLPEVADRFLAAVVGRARGPARRRPAPTRRRRRAAADPRAPRRVRELVDEAVARRRDAALRRAGRLAGPAPRTTPPPSRRPS